MIAFVLARLREPSSYAGLGALLAAAGIHADDAVVQATISSSGRGCRPDRGADARKIAPGLERHGASGLI